MKETESLLSHAFMHTVIQPKSYEPDSECENKKDKPLLMIVFDIFFPPQEWDF